MTNSAIIEAAARALRDSVPEVVLAIEAAALEKAAKVAETHLQCPDTDRGISENWLRKNIAAAIRALKKREELPAPPTESMEQVLKPDDRDTRRSIEEIMEGEQVIFSEADGPDNYLKLVVAGHMSELLLEALEKFVKRHKRRALKQEAAN